MLGNNINIVKKICKKLMEGVSKVGLKINDEKQNIYNLAERIGYINAEKVQK